jgi:chemotaxis protein MotB
MSGRARKQEEDKENHERWLITYADLITLLMVFFVVLYAMSMVDQKKYSELSQSLAIVFGQTGRSGMLDGGRTVIPDNAVHKQKRNITNTREQIRRMLQSMGLEGKISVRDEGRGIVLSVKDTVFFRPGSADLGSQAREVMSSLGKLLSPLPNSIRVEGHTDNIPIRNARYYSNWELSTDRAISVLHYLTQNTAISPERLSAAGYGEYKPLTSNDNESGRAVNRRVDIVLLSEDFKKFEPGTLQNIDETVDTSEENVPVSNESGSVNNRVPQNIHSDQGVADRGESRTSEDEEL